ncbi:hypothetical protein EG329_001017 [Mollisiaceae sp. DMI_Dod_QoI]|nr:hypothetical protein EG329_001017 [Helotiales sp. DMI_Dod_QoI]
MFQFSLYLAGEPHRLAGSHFINISVSAAPSSTSSSSASSTTALHSTSTTSSVNTNSTPVNASPSPTASTQPSGGLSTGAKAGIGFGVSAVVVIGLLAGLFVFRRSKNRGYAQEPYFNDGAWKSELSAESRLSLQPKHELNGENSQTPETYELPAAHKY